jgi:hypothetical protein
MSEQILITKTKKYLLKGELFIKNERHQIII